MNGEKESREILADKLSCPTDVSQWSVGLGFSWISGQISKQNKVGFFI